MSPWIKDPPGSGGVGDSWTRGSQFQAQVYLSLGGEGYRVAFLDPWADYPLDTFDPVAAKRKAVDLARDLMRTWMGEWS